MPLCQSICLRRLSVSPRGVCFSWCGLNHLGDFTEFCSHACVRLQLLCLCRRHTTVPLKTMLSRSFSWVCSGRVSDDFSTGLDSPVRGASSSFMVKASINPAVCWNLVAGIENNDIAGYQFLSWNSNFFAIPQHAGCGGRHFFEGFNCFFASVLLAEA